MGYNDHDPEISSIWVRKVLLETPGIVAIIGQRAYDDVGVIKPVVYPFVYWTAVELTSQSDAAGVYKIEWKVDIRGVWRFSPAQASRSPCRPLSKLMRKALTEFGDQDNSFPHFDLPGVGAVHESKYLNWYRPPARDDGDYRVIEHGVSVKLVTTAEE